MPVDVLGIIQARVSSTRLPRKVLKPILGRPMLERQIERVRSCRLIDKIILATSTGPEDRALSDLGKLIDVEVFRGDLDNVLDRFYRAAEKFSPRHVVRLTGDCPLIDPRAIDDLITFYFNGNHDFASNCTHPTYPDGLDAEIFRFEVLELAWKEAVLPSHLEHVTLFFEDQPERFRLGNLFHSEDLSDLRWTVDEPEDFEFVTKVYEALYPKNPEFGMGDVLSLLQERPELTAINRRFDRNEGLAKSRDQDRMYLHRDEPRNA